MLGEPKHRIGTSQAPTGTFQLEHILSRSVPYLELRILQYAFEVTL